VYCIFSAIQYDYMYVMLQYWLVYTAIWNYLFTAVHFRAKKLAEFLLDRNLQGPMKRTAEELQKQDVTSAAFLRQLTACRSAQLYGIFRNKKDPYFCWQQGTEEMQMSQLLI
jgi:hypothetical protein